MEFLFFIGETDKEDRITAIIYCTDWCEIDILQYHYLSYQKYSDQIAWGDVPEYVQNSIIRYVDNNLEVLNVD